MFSTIWATYYTWGTPMILSCVPYQHLSVMSLQMAWHQLGTIPSAASTRMTLLGPWDLGSSFMSFSGEIMIFMCQILPNLCADHILETLMERDPLLASKGKIWGCELLARYACCELPRGGSIPEKLSSEAHKDWVLTHCGQVLPYGITELGQPWVR